MLFSHFAAAPLKAFLRKPQSLPCCRLGASGLSLLCAHSFPWRPERLCDVGMERPSGSAP